MLHCWAAMGFCAEVVVYVATFMSRCIEKMQVRVCRDMLLSLTPKYRPTPNFNRKIQKSKAFGEVNCFSHVNLTKKCVSAYGIFAQTDAPCFGAAGFQGSAQGMLPMGTHVNVPRLQNRVKALRGEQSREM